MDLKFSKKKSEIIKRIEACDDEALLTEIELMIENHDSAEVQITPITEEMLVAKIKEGLACFERGEVVSVDKLKANISKA